MNKTQVEGLSLDDSASRRPSNKPSTNSRKINYNYACDADRFECFNHFMSTLSECKRIERLVHVYLEQVKNFVMCSNSSVFALLSDLIDFKFFNKDVAAQKAVIEGKYVDSFGLARLPLAEPGFSKFLDAGKRCRTQEYMSFPVFDPEGRVMLSLQVSAKKKQGSKSLAGFTMFDELFL